MTTTQRIFIEAQRLFRPKKHGMDVVARELLQRLRQVAGPWQFTVLIKDDNDPCLTTGPNLEVATLPGGFYPWWEQWILPNWAKRQPDQWLHCTGNTAPLWGPNPLLLTIHDLIFLEENYLLKKDGGSWYQRFGNAYRALVVPWAARRARFIITVSALQKQLIHERLGIPLERIAVVYNGADGRFFAPASPEAIQQAGARYGLEGWPYLFFIANTEPRKNTLGVLKAFAHFCHTFPEHPHRLVIKGLTAEQLANRIEMAGAGGAAPRIHRVDYIDYADLPLLYQGAAALWFPSFKEGFGLPIVEAMASGTPVITANCSVMPEIAGDAAWYIDPHQPEHLATQTHQLLSNPDLAEQLVARGRQRATAFTWEKSVEALLKVYAQVLE